MGMCGNATRQNSKTNENEPDQNANAKEKAKGIFSVFSGALVDNIVKPKLPTDLQTAVNVAQTAKKGYDAVQNINELVNGGDKSALIEIKPPIDQNVQEIRKLALKEDQIKKSDINVQLHPASGIALNPQSRLQNLSINNPIKIQPNIGNQNGLVSWLQGGLSQTPQIPSIKPQKGILQSNLSNLQEKLKKQPSALIPSAISVREADKSIIFENSKIGSKLNQSLMPQLINPELSNNIQKSNIASFIGYEDMINNQGHGALKGIEIKVSKIKVY